MTTIDFPDAIADLVRRFPAKDSSTSQIGPQQDSFLTVVFDRQLPTQEDSADDTEWFDNFPV